MFKSIRNIIISIILMISLIVIIYVVPTLMHRKHHNGENVINYNSFEESTEIVLNSNLFKTTFYTCACVEIFNLIILSIFSIQNKVEKEYVRDTKLVIEPVLAEAIIDRKIGAKELVMTCISNMICKGNLKCINNDWIEAIHKNNLSDYEYRVMKMIFNNTDTIKFEDIKNIFKKDNMRTEELNDDLKYIKKAVFDTLINEKIYNIKCEKILNLMKIISKLLYVEIICLVFLILFQTTSTSDFIIINMALLFCMYIIKPIREIKALSDEPNLFNTMINIFGVTFIVPFIYAFALHMRDINFIIIFVFITILLLLNTIIFKKSNTHVFTKKGKEAYKKAYGLKSYIDDYSLMKERELESTILWDDYLTYAIAFGISNKVTNRFGEELMNANILLKKLDKFLKF